MTTTTRPKAAKTGLCPVCGLDVDLTRGKPKAHPAKDAPGDLCGGTGGKPGDPAPTAEPVNPAPPHVLEPSLELSIVEGARPEGAWSGAVAVNLDPELCDPDPHNPRVDLGNVDDLALSLIAVGMLEPIIVTPGPLEDRFTIVAGHRRVAAAKVANLPEVPALIRADIVPGSDRSIIAQVVENLHREALSPLEEARAYDLLRQLGMKQTDIALQVGVNQGQVSKRLALLKLPDDIAVRVGADDPGAIDVAAAVEATRLPAAAKAKAFDEIRRGANADSAVRRARQDADREAAHQAVIDNLEAAKVALVDAPLHGYWTGDREDRPLATGADGERQHAGGRGIDVTYADHHDQPCHGAAVTARDDVIYVCLDPTRHGYKTAAEEEAEHDADRARAAEERELEQAAARAAIAERRAAARTAALADVKRPAMAEAVVAWTVARLTADDMTTSSGTIAGTLAAWTDADLADTADDADLELDDDETATVVARLVDTHGALRVAYMTVIADVEGILSTGWYARQLAGQPIIAHHFERLAEYADYTPTAAELELITPPAPPLHAGDTIPRDDQPDGALAWYQPDADAIDAGDEARWVTDLGELAAIVGQVDAGGNGSLVILPVEDRPADAQETVEGNASPLDDLVDSTDAAQAALDEAFGDTEVVPVGTEHVEAPTEPAPAKAKRAGKAVDPGDVPTPGERCPASRKLYAGVSGDATGVPCPRKCGALVDTTTQGRVRDHDVPLEAAPVG